ncbi:MAG: excinuclease ABC subunit A, partial [Planctomycetota bacterium]
MLWARCGTPTCWHRDEDGRVCGNPITATAPTQIVESVLASSAGKKLMVCAPLVRARKGFHKESLEQMVRAGLVRARVNGTIVELRDAQKRGGENPFGLGRYEAHTIDAVVDRIVARVDDRQRLAESIETTLKAGGGNLLLLVDDGTGGWTEHRFSEHFSCPDHPECSLEELEPRVFSFNSPQGACEACAGLGTIDQFDEDLVVPDQAKPVAEAIEPFRKNGRRMNIWYARRIRLWCTDEGVNPATPFAKLAAKARRSLMHGQEDGWEGVLPHLRRRFTETDSEFV